MAAFAAWGRIVLIGPTGAQIAAWTISGSGRPDITTVDSLARLQVDARRAGVTIHLRDLDPDLADLLDLAGLRREVGGEPEGGEEMLDVGEGLVPGNPIP